MLKNLNKKIEDLKGDLINTTCKLVQIKSVEGAPQSGMPFGKGVNETLAAALQECALLGLKTKNVDGYAGHAEIGQGDEIIGILCHLDVVPEGDNWTYPPYGAEIHEGKIYGRGAIDDKGPAAAVIYALKAVKDLNINLNKRVRLILGTNEESGWKGIKYYLENEENPALGFSPDASFPVIHAEKGVLTFTLNADFEKIEKTEAIKIKEIKGGNAPNMVPDYCQAIIETDNILELQEFIEHSQYNLEVEEYNNYQLIIKSYGKSAHGSDPANGQNAISQLLVFLNSINMPHDDIGDLINFYQEKIGMDYNGKKMECYLKDEISGDLVFNTGMITLNENGVEITINIRYPVTYKKEDVLSRIRKETNSIGLEINDIQNFDPLLVEKDDPLVEKLMKIYREITGENQEPEAIGGGTYARTIDKAVAFGAALPGKNGGAHQKDEYVEIDNLVTAAKIYAGAIIELAGE